MEAVDKIRTFLTEVKVETKKISWPPSRSCGVRRGW